MRILIAAVGRLRAGPEHELALDYARRAEGLGRNLALAPVEIVEVESRPPGDTSREAAALWKATPDDGRKVLLDERGQDLSSRQIAERLARWRDEGVPTTTFWIGGADGSAQTLKDQADLKMAFGRQVWPHRLVRVMLAEQIYRAVTILSATPYHRD
jgi:23S rRNA (pseudouridine1915-N3)-methyltransferase